MTALVSIAVDHVGDMKEKPDYSLVIMDESGIEVERVYHGTTKTARQFTLYGAKTLTIRMTEQAIAEKTLKPTGLTDLVEWQCTTQAEKADAFARLARDLEAALRTIAEGHDWSGHNCRELAEAVLTPPHLRALHPKFNVEK